MKICLSDAGKRYNRDWIFRNLHFTFQDAATYALTGPNGSGKSTLLQLLSGSIAPSNGKITWMHNSQEWNAENVYTQVVVVAPYLELIEEMTAMEFLAFHNGFKPLNSGTSTRQIVDIIGLKKAADKQIRYYSSGMKQRLKLAQAIFSQAPLLLLDEPCTNLDADGIALYHHLIEQYCTGKTIIVSSNDQQEYLFCTHRLSILDYK